jgi:hypothetical protein
MALSRWAKAHGHKEPPAPYVPKVEPEPVVEHSDDDAPLMDMELSEEEKIQRDVEDRDLGAAVEIARMVFESLNNYKPRGARS